MNIRFSGKNLSVTAGMKEHLEEKLGKLDKYAPRLVESHVILKKEKYVFIAEITLLAKNLRAYGEGRSKENVFTAERAKYRATCRDKNERPSELVQISEGHAGANAVDGGPKKLWHAHRDEVR